MFSRMLPAVLVADVLCSPPGPACNSRSRTFSASNWQDWGLRNARKTAFHAAVNYFCRQLGIVAFESPMPIAYADPDSHDFAAPGSPSPYDDEYDYAMEPQTPAPHTPAPGSKSMLLGFVPPSHTPIPGALRARKSKSRKAMLRTLGADG